jgi:acyl-CoA thioesterase II
VDFSTMMALEPHGPDTFVGVGPDYHWGGLYGGQIVAQGLRSAGLTVEERFRVHSLHAYFVRMGDSSEPIRFEVDRVRNGRSFATRTVVARQSTGAILTMTASFQVEEEGLVVQTAVAPVVPAPEALGEDSWSEAFERRVVPGAGEPGRTRAWTRVRGGLGDEPILHAAGMAYTSDDLPNGAVLLLDPTFDPGAEEHPFMNASLDHAIWFHRPFRADQWLLQDFRAEQLMGSRGVAVGEFYDQGGTHVATVAQEVLCRRVRQG